jgi:phage tail sheath gpL-like
MGQGASNAPVGEKSALYVCKKLSATGTATINTRYEITSGDQAAGLAGYGSEGHRMARMHIKKNPSGRLYMCFHLPSSGAGIASATGNTVVTGPATRSGSFVVNYMGSDIEVAYVAGDTATGIGEILEEKINGSTFLPVSAVNTAGTVAVTAKQAGASQNASHRMTVVKNGDTGSGVGVTCSVALLAGGADGAVTELSLYQAALTAMSAVPDYYVANPVGLTTFLSEGGAFVTNRSLPGTGLRSRYFGAFTGSLSACATLAIARNSELVQIAHQRNADQSPDEILAWYVASYQKEESTQTRFNFDGYSANGFISPARNFSDWLNFDDLGDAVNDGIASIQSTETGAYLVMGITTRSKDSTGLLDDFRATESHRIRIMHEVADVLWLNERLTFTNFAQRPDVLLPDGTVDPASLRDIQGRTTTPFLFKSWVKQQFEPFFDERLQGKADWFDSMQSRIDPTNNGRMQVSASGRTIDLHHQTTFRLAETTS